MFFKSDPSFQQFIINNIKKMLNKTCIMCSIITNVEMVLLNHLKIIFIAIKTIDIKPRMSIKNMHKYRYLV